eukprot:692743-Pelagomonas_calceolata.AAC.5
MATTQNMPTTMSCSFLPLSPHTHILRCCSFAAAAVVAAAAVTHAGSRRWTRGAAGDDWQTLPEMVAS